MGKRPQLGAWMEFNARALKSRKNGGLTSWWRLKFTKPRRGMYVGSRTIYDGKTKWDISYDEDGRSYAEGWIFERTAAREVWLFVTHERQNPQHVFPEDVCMEAANDPTS